MAAARYSCLLEAPCKLPARPFVAARPARRVALVVAAAEQQPQAKKKKPANPLNAYTPPSREGAQLRAEAEAPFRSFRLFIFGAGVAGASLATLFGLPGIIGALGGAPNATKSVAEALSDLAINLGSLAVCAYFVRGDLQAREKQLARLMREDELGACQLELANGRVLRLAQLRGFARAVMIAGTPQQVADALAAAEPYKQQLQERGVLVVPLPFVAGGAPSSASPSSSSDTSAAASLAPPGADDLRWRATPVRMDEWRRWFEQQAQLANKGLDGGLYVSLRLDGRVRGSGVGSPPWPIMAAQLPPTEGFFGVGSFLDGMDGKV
ncbi:hypothetical protein ABPG77_003706 [Micractinium sp. CCAP 211/92]